MFDEIAGQIAGDFRVSLGRRLESGLNSSGRQGKLPEQISRYGFEMSIPMDKGCPVQRRGGSDHRVNGRNPCTGNLPQEYRVKGRCFIDRHKRFQKFAIIFRHRDKISFSPGQAHSRVQFNQA
jgi:hypothetical protein